jgi:hypothetical protein
LPRGDWKLLERRAVLRPIEIDVEGFDDDLGHGRHAHRERWLVGFDGAGMIGTIGKVLREETPDVIAPAEALFKADPGAGGAWCT